LAVTFLAVTFLAVTFLAVTFLAVTFLAVTFFEEVLVLDNTNTLSKSTNPHLNEECEIKIF